MNFPFIPGKEDGTVSKLYVNFFTYNTCIRTVYKIFLQKKTVFLQVWHEGRKKAVEGIVRQWTPKLRIESDNHSFREQILKVIEDYNIVVDITKDPFSEKEPLIVIADHVGFYEYNIIKALPEGEEQPDLYIILILPDKTLPEMDERMITFYQDELKSTMLADTIEGLSVSLMSEIRDDYNMVRITKKLTDANEVIEEYSRSLTNVRMIQNKIMIPPSDMGSFETYTVYEPYRIVSGDVLFVKCLYDKVFIMIADVTDHGYASGIFGSVLYALANNYVQNTPALGQDADMWGLYMVKAAKMFYPDTRDSSREAKEIRNLFSANATFAVIDKQKQKIDICFYGSGMEPPVMIRSDAAECITADAGMGVALNEGNIPAKIQSRKFYPGDMIMFYTDGATEIFSDAESGQKDISKMYSSSKIVKSVEDTLSKMEASPKNIVESVLRDADAYSISKDIFSDNTRENNILPYITDDLTIFCIKWRNNR